MPNRGNAACRECEQNLARLGCPEDDSRQLFRPHSDSVRSDHTPGDILSVCGRTRRIRDLRDPATVECSLKPTSQLDRNRAILVDCQRREGPRDVLAVGRAQASDEARTGSCWLPSPHHFQDFVHVLLPPPHTDPKMGMGTFTPTPTPPQA